MTSTQSNGLPPINKIRKERVIIFIIGLLILYGVCFFYSKRESKAPNSVPYAESDFGLVEGSLLKLPDTYSDIKRPPQIEPVPEIKPEPVKEVIIPKMTPTKQTVVNSIDEEKEKALNSDIGFKLSPLKKAQSQQASPSSFLLNSKLQKPASLSNMLLTGTIIPSVLITGINSDLAGNIIAQVSTHIYDSITGTKILIPQGSRLFGAYNNSINWNDNRLQIAWNRIIFPNGSTLFLGEKGMAGTDLSGRAGIKDRVNNHYGKLAGAILLSTFLSVGAKQSQGDIENDHPTISQEIASNVASDINSTGQKIVQRQLNVEPTIEIKAGYSFNILVSKDIHLNHE